MRKSRMLAINAILITLIAVFTMIPISIGPLKLAFLMLLPVIIAAQLEGRKAALFAGAFLGITSFIGAFFSASPTAPIMRNPMVSVFPRLFVGLVAYWVYKLCDKKFGKTMKGLLSSGISAISAVITNTVLVLLMIWAFYFGKEIEGTAINAEFMSALISINFVVEIIGCAILAPPILIALKKALGNSNGGA